ncbi:MAG: hypothetical protein ONB05_01410 [candidate division KSB1 bacterium]|nr:hypothetical protein [candidate division KSB1 bacterium]
MAPVAPPQPPVEPEICGRENTHHQISYFVSSNSATNCGKNIRIKFHFVKSFFRTSNFFLDIIKDDQLAALVAAVETEINEGKILPLFDEHGEFSD